MIKTTKKLKNTVVNPAKIGSPKAALPKVAAVKPEPIKSQPVQATNHESRQINRISLELIKPGAKNVSVAGSFNGWKPETTPLMERGHGRWVGDVTIKPGRHEYLFVVDGQWLPDPNAKESVQNPFGGKNSVLIVSE